MQPRGGIKTEGAGGQRERLLESWIGTMMNNGVVINEQEECKAVRRAPDGDYFTVETEKGDKREPLAYRARRVVLALGNRGGPMKLRVPGEEMKITRNGRSEDKVMYVLSNPDDFKQKKVIVIGGGNASVEAAVDLVARRKGDQIEFRASDEINDVTLILRTDFKNDVKFLNKQQIYQCIDEGKVKVLFGTTTKEIREREVIVMDTWTKEEKARIANDYVLALIGAAPPIKFLESVGITIPKS
jgi:thioredoxin reductase